MHMEAIAQCAIVYPSVFGTPRMKFSRRGLFKLFLGLGVGSALWSLLPGHRARDPWAGLRAFVDILIPEDETPGASQLGVVDSILAAAQDAPSRLELLRQGTAWLDGQARRFGAADFAGLPQSKREALVGEAAGHTLGSMPRTFFQMVLDDAFFHYYANPQSWAAIGYEGPPQPRGYPDHANPPRALRS